jgi:hypothetical protein
MPKQRHPAAVFVASRGDVLRALNLSQLEAMEEGPMHDIPLELGEWKFSFSRTKLQNGRTRFVVEGEGPGRLLGIRCSVGVSDAFDMTAEGVVHEIPLDDEDYCGRI